MRSAISLVAVFHLVLFATGCDKLTTSPAAARPSGVAVIDLDQVARALGIDQVLVNRVNQQEESLNGQLLSLQSALRDQYRQKSRQVEAQTAAGGQAADSTPTKEQLSGLEGQLNRQLAEAQQKARKQLSAYRLQLVRQFRAEVVPVAREVAAARGLGVVLTNNDSVLLACDETHDITSAVVARLREVNAAAPAASAPAASATAAAPSATQRR